MYSKILSELGQDYYKDNFPNDGQRFVAWYLRNIHNLDTFEQKTALRMGQATSRSMLFISIIKHAQFTLFKVNFTAGTP